MHWRWTLIAVPLIAWLWPSRLCDFLCGDFCGNPYKLQNEIVSDADRPAMAIVVPLIHGHALTSIRATWQPATHASYWPPCDPRIDKHHRKIDLVFYYNLQTIPAALEAEVRAITAGLIGRCLRAVRFIAANLTREEGASCNLFIS